MKKLIGALALVGLFSSAANAASVTYYDNHIANLNNGGPGYTFNHRWLTDSNPDQFQLNLSKTGLLTFALNDTIPDTKDVLYKIFENTASSANPNKVTYDPSAAIKTFTLSELQSTSFHLAAGHYMVEMFKSAVSGANNATTSVSAVPIPGAALLFGSALMGVGALRRKKADSLKVDLAA